MAAPSKKARKSTTTILSLPADVLVSSILSRVVQRESGYKDLVFFSSSCRSFNNLEWTRELLHQVSLDNAPLITQSSNPRYKIFIDRCVGAGNIRGHFILGMSYAFCLEERLLGLLHLNAARTKYQEALYAFAILNFSDPHKHGTAFNILKNLQASSRPTNLLLCRIAILRMLPQDDGLKLQYLPDVQWSCSKVPRDPACGKLITFINMGPSQWNLYCCSDNCMIGLEYELFRHDLSHLHYGLI